ncbi:pathogenesis-related thaumatin-like protein 3.5 [Tasmannia lanceolata]|uniref:pathogenesis-related thaumatin-like protein 3.5 n=1 Tax=Tasmannia lanceolata TaxID=3420 RepID=UPI0040630598
MRPSKNFRSFFFLCSLLFTNSLSCTFIVTNNCPYTIWPGTLAGAGTPQLPTTGFRLDSGQSVGIQVTPGWSGRIWARTGCKFEDWGVGICGTGDCGGKMECDGMGPTPPTTLFEITLGKGDDKDYYDVSVVDGYNLPILIVPRGVYGGCNATGCAADLNSGCPKELQVVEGGEATGVVGCKSACVAFGRDEYCCSGEFASPTTCGPSSYSNIFKRACPKAYSYAFDDGSSTFTCKAFDYAITFCPTITGLRRSNNIATVQPIRGDNNGEAGQMASSSNILPIHMTFLLLFILYI